MKNYPRSFPYEIFIRIAFGCGQGAEHEANAQYMKRLLDAEDEHDPAASEFLAQLKRNIGDALDQFMKDELTVDEKLTLMEMKHKVEKSATGSELCLLVDESLKLTGKLLR